MGQFFPARCVDGGAAVSIRIVMAMARYKTPSRLDGGMLLLVLPVETTRSTVDKERFQPSPTFLHQHLRPSTIMSSSTKKAESCPLLAPYHRHGITTGSQPQNVRTAPDACASPAAAGRRSGRGVWQRTVRPWDGQGRTTSTERTERTEHAEHVQHEQGPHPMERWMTQCAADEPWNNVGHVQRQSEAATTTAVGERTGSVGSSVRALCGSEGD